MIFEVSQKTLSKRLLTPVLNSLCIPRLSYVWNSIDQAYLQKCTQKQNATHPKTESEWKSIEAPDELRVKPVSHEATNVNFEELKLKKSTTTVNVQDIRKIKNVSQKERKHKLKKASKTLEPTVEPPF